MTLDEMKKEVIRYGICNGLDVKKEGGVIQIIENGLLMYIILK